MEHIGRIKCISIDSKDILLSVVVCPHCGNKTTYGNMCMHCGVHGCNKCIEELSRTIEKDRKYDYDSYVQKANEHEYEPYCYVGE